MEKNYKRNSQVNSTIQESEKDKPLINCVITESESIEIIEYIVPFLEWLQIMREKIEEAERRKNIKEKTYDISVSRLLSTGAITEAIKKTNKERKCEDKGKKYQDKQAVAADNSIDCDEELKTLTILKQQARNYINDIVDDFIIKSEGSWTEFNPEVYVIKEILISRYVYNINLRQITSYFKLPYVTFYRKYKKIL